MSLNCFFCICTVTTLSELQLCLWCNCYPLVLGGCKSCKCQLNLWALQTSLIFDWQGTEGINSSLNICITHLMAVFPEAKHKQTGTKSSSDRSKTCTWEDNMLLSSCSCALQAFGGVLGQIRMFSMSLHQGWRLFVNTVQLCWFSCCFVWLFIVIFPLAVLKTFV